MSLLHACALSGAACRLPAPQERPALTLVEKGTTQTIFDAQGRVQRVLIDADGDRYAEVQFLYGPEGTPRVAEMDMDRDGVVERWEHFAADGSLERVGRSVRSRGRPDVWELPTRLAPGAPEAMAEELDTDGDGRADRRLIRDADGVLTAILIDSERDGSWARRVEVKRAPRP